VVTGTEQRFDPADPGDSHRTRWPRATPARARASLQSGLQDGPAPYRALPASAIRLRADQLLEEQSVAAACSTIRATDPREIGVEHLVN